MGDIEQLEAKFSALIANLSASKRQALSRNLGRALLVSQRRRITAQQNPDGSRYEPRKPQKIRRKKGRIRRRAMFVKLKTARFLKVRSSSNEVTVGFGGRASTIAEVHQYGKAVTMGKRRKRVTLPQRELVGFSDEDRALIEELVIEQLSL